MQLLNSLDYAVLETGSQAVVRIDTSPDMPSGLSNRLKVASSLENQEAIPIVSESSIICEEEKYQKQTSPALK